MSQEQNPHEVKIQCILRAQQAWAVEVSESVGLPLGIES